MQGRQEPKVTGCTKREALVMDMWDANHSMQKIRRKTGLRLSTIKATISAYHDKGEQSRHKAAMREGSAKLLKALQRAYNERETAA